MRRTLPKPGARAAARRALAAEYCPRFELARGDDPWTPAGANAYGFAPLDDQEIRSLGLLDLLASGYRS